MTWEIKRDEVDRWTGSAITNVSPNTPEQQALVDEMNAQLELAQQPAPQQTGIVIDEDAESWCTMMMGLEAAKSQPHIRQEY